MKESLRMDEKDTLFKKGEKAASLSAFVLLAVTILKGIVSLISGSVALLADSIHSFADIFSSIAVWTGLKLVRKQPTERFPYGYYKAETFALLIVAVTIATSGILILKEAVDRFFEPTTVLFPSVVLVVAAFSGVVSYFLGRYKKNVGNLSGSQSLIGEGQHSMVDVYTSLLVFVGVFFASLGYPMAEVLAGLAIGVYIIKIGLMFGRDAILVLMDASLSSQQIKEMKEIAESVPGVLSVHNLRFRKSGPVSFGEMHIEVQQELALDRAHTISSEVEERIKKRFKEVESVTVHVGLTHKERLKIGIPVIEDKGMESITSLHFAKAPLFALIEIEKGQVRNIGFKVNKAAKLQRKKGVIAAQFLVNERVDTILAGSVGEGPFHVLRDNLIQIYVLPARLEIREALRLLNENKLEKMTEPTEQDGAQDA
jgi:cation diffusion facilitator family transporter